jgi:hypothetical protein
VRVHGNEGSVTQQVYITTAEGLPFFFVHDRVSDAFIDEEVEARCGKQSDGEAHEWAAYDVEEVETPNKPG